MWRTTYLIIGERDNALPSVGKVWGGGFSCPYTFNKLYCVHLFVATGDDVLMHRGSIDISVIMFRLDNNCTLVST